MTQTTEQTKTIGNYKVNFKSYFLDDVESSEYVFLDLSITEDLKELIKKVALEKKVEDSYRDGSDGTKFKRHLAKTPIFSALYSNYRQILFGVDLLKNSKITLKFVDIEILNRAIDDLKEDVRRLIKNYLTISELNVTISYNL